MKKRGDEEEEEDEDEDEVLKDVASKKSSLPSPPLISFFLPIKNRASSATANATAPGHSRHASSSGSSLEACSSQRSGAVVEEEEEELGAASSSSSSSCEE